MADNDEPGPTGSSFGENSVPVCRSNQVRREEVAPAEEPPPKRRAVTHGESSAETSHDSGMLSLPSRDGICIPGPREDSGNRSIPSDAHVENGRPYVLALNAPQPQPPPESRGPVLSGESSPKNSQDSVNQPPREDTNVISDSTGESTAEGPSPVSPPTEAEGSTGSVEMADEGEEHMPRDGKIVKELLRSMNVDDYEPQVINQFLEFAYRYIADVLIDAQTYSEHAEKSLIDSDDVKLAIQGKVNFSFSQPPPREVLLELARSINKIPLPRPVSAPGLRLPPDQDILISPNYQLAILNSQIIQPAEETEEDEEAPPNPDQNASQNLGDSFQGTPQRVSFSLGAKDPR